MPILIWDKSPEIEAFESLRRDLAQSFRYVLVRVRPFPYAGALVVSMQWGIRDMTEFTFLWPALIMSTNDLSQGAMVVPFLFLTRFRIQLMDRC